MSIHIVHTPAVVVSNTRALVRANNTSGQSIAHNTLSQITGWSETFDAGNNFSSNVFTAPRAGKYRVIGALKWAASVWAAADSYILSIRKNGAVLVNAARTLESATSVANSMSINDVVDCVASDTIDIAITQANVLTSTKTLDTVSANNYLVIEEVDLTTTNS